ncbi:AraC family transcriptional regulator [Actinomycetospora endophytica]|uniref:AraC family transcriptional regulator n=1 Tax=Actinomycetospora endophytica TaxID=2291215 RepID=A0ABS8PHN0_9PSEU|nr:AraC family transcriptional regulator [Actinomycetospora endophytica]MCD2196886.1 AraC family transcriptional regulator [Actinomycetospora endophytica]
MGAPSTTTSDRAARAHEPLAAHAVMETADVDEAQHVVTDVYVPHELDSLGGRPLDARLNSIASERLTLGYLVYGANASLDLPPLEHCYHVNLTLNGRTEVTRRAGRERAVTEAGRSGAVLLPTEDSTVTWSPEAVQFAMKFPRGPLEEHLGGLIGRPVTDPLDFDISMDLSDGPGAALMAAVRFLQTEIDRPGGISDSPLARAQLETYVMTALLHGVRHQYTDALHAPRAEDRPTLVRQALEFIETHAGEPFSIPQLAKRLGVSTRTLQVTFARNVGMTPSEYVRDQRLSRVHAELVTGDPSSTSVTECAAAWGFLHQGRFSEQYRHKYGELPSRTLRNG